jgi:hypothetical protein
MDFIVEFYETVAGKCPVREFLDELKASDPDDFAAVVAGLAKLRDRQYHREPLSKALGGGLFELRHVGKLNTRELWFFCEESPDRRGTRPPEQRPGDPDSRTRYRAGTDA